jgi:hypothetical protein
VEISSLLIEEQDIAATTIAKNSLMGLGYGTFAASNATSACLFFSIL